MSTPRKIYYTKRELAKELGISTRTVQDWTAKRILPELRPNGRTLLYDIDAVREALTRRTIPAKRIG